MPSSYNDPTHWRDRAKQMRVLAEQMHGSVSKQMMRRIAEDYERLARTAEAKGFVPAEARLFAHRKNRGGARLARIADLEIPSFLKRGPATAEEVRAPAASAHQKIDRDTDAGSLLRRWKKMTSIARGYCWGARDRMTALGIPTCLQRFYFRTTLYPATRASGPTLREFDQCSTPEQEERVENAPRAPVQ
jgi:hypothetical protein